MQGERLAKSLEKESKETVLCMYCFVAKQSRTLKIHFSPVLQNIHGFLKAIF